MLTLHNTLSRKKEVFKPRRKISTRFFFRKPKLRKQVEIPLRGKPLKDGVVGVYTCGPTVYWYAHIGNLRTYIFEDILKRVLEYNGYCVKHVMNITDVGHLTSDADTGEDKLEKGAKRENKTAWQIAEFYAKKFKENLKSLNILEPNIWLKATDTIKEQIDLIKVLKKNGFTYQIEDGVYFDTSRLKNYGVLWGNKKPIELKAGARVEMVKGKKNITDFALWKLTPPGIKRQMEWDSPWGRGFPGWHTECVAMSVNTLGIPFDIHCGGIDHIPIHHTNEIAQTEAAYGKKLANFWLHGEFLNIKGGKISKSKGNIITLDTLIKKGFNPLCLRYLFLTAHYRAKLDFTWESLKASQNALQNLQGKILQFHRGQPSVNLTEGCPLSVYQKKFLEFINDDLNMPKALALMWQMLNDPALPNKEKYQLALDMDKVFGLGLKNIKTEKTKIPTEILALAEQREKARKTKNWQKADEIRKEIQKLGYDVEDTEKGPNLKRQELPTKINS